MKLFCLKPSNIEQMLWVLIFIQIYQNRWPINKKINKICASTPFVSECKIGLFKFFCIQLHSTTTGDVPHLLSPCTSSCGMCIVMKTASSGVGPSRSALSVGPLLVPINFSILIRDARTNTENQHAMRPPFHPARPFKSGHLFQFKIPPSLSLQSCMAGSKGVLINCFEERSPGGWYGSSQGRAP